MSPRLQFYIIFIMFVLTIYAVYSINNYYKIESFMIENFEVDNEISETLYKNRKFVIDFFEALGEKPSPEEIKTLSEMKDPQEIIKEVLKNFDNIGKKKTPLLNFIDVKKDATTDMDTPISSLPDAAENKESFHDDSDGEDEMTRVEDDTDVKTDDESYKNDDDEKICVTKKALIEFFNLKQRV